MCVLSKSTGHDITAAAFAAGHVSLVGQGALWMLLSYQQTEVQEPPQACYSQLMHSPPFLLFSMSVCLMLFLSASSPAFSLSCPFP